MTISDLEKIFGKKLDFVSRERLVEAIEELDRKCSKGEEYIVSFEKIFDCKLSWINRERIAEMLIKTHRYH